MSKKNTGGGGREERSESFFVDGSIGRAKLQWL